MRAAPSILKLRLTLLHFSHHRFHLIGGADDFDLLITFGHDTDQPRSVPLAEALAKAHHSVWTA